MLGPASDLDVVADHEDFDLFVEHVTIQSGVDYKALQDGLTSGFLQFVPSERFYWQFVSGRDSFCMIVEP